MTRLPHLGGAGFSFMHHYSISPLLFGGVQSLVGAFDERIGINDESIWVGSHTGTDGDLKQVVLFAEFAPLDRQANPLGSLQGAIGRGVVEDDGEFLTAVTGCD